MSPICGDGVVDPGESCDLGEENSDGPAAECRTDCSLASCGDGRLDDGEECDEGAANSNETPDACRLTCVLPACGDDIADSDEQCDTGADRSDTTPNACRTSFLVASCGDDFVDNGEQCDTGALRSDVSPNACRMDCMAAYCGDGVLDDGEQCDTGANRNDVSPDACRSNCQAAHCGDDVVDTGETCDDGNAADNDGCDRDCVPTMVVSVTAGSWHSCALFRTGAVRCWGQGSDGQLGYENNRVIGDEPWEMPPGDVDVGEPVSHVAAGGRHTCALLDTGTVRCWGSGGAGRLGYGSVANVGDGVGEMPPPDVELDGAVAAISAGGEHTCALMETGAVKCWGNGADGRLGYEDTTSIGDQPGEMPAADVPLGGLAVALSLGWQFSCALLENGNVECWGLGGRLGTGDMNAIGDDPGEMPPSDLDLGGSVASISVGSEHACALLDSGEVKCWGSGVFGALGYGIADGVGDHPGEMPPASVDVGGDVLGIACGGSFTCALLDGGGVSCWGYGTEGNLGYASTQTLGDDPGELPTGLVDIGGTVQMLSTGSSRACVLLDVGSVRCWGRGTGGYLGYGNFNNIGDDETPASAGNIPMF